MLCEPVDLEVGVELAELDRDRHVALRVPEPDRRGDVERALAARLASHPARCRPGGNDEVTEQEIDLDWIADVRRVTRSFQHHEIASRLLGERGSSGDG